MPPDARVARVAARQHGAVTAAQLYACGVTRHGIAHRVAEGRLTRVYRGVFLVGPLTDRWTMVMAAVLATNGVASHRTALALYGLQAEVPNPVDLAVAVNARTRQGVRVHRTTLDGSEVTRREGIPTTTPLRTFADVRGTMRVEEFQRALEEAVLRRVVSKRQAADVLGEEPRLTRSEAERKLLRLLKAARLPPPETNVRLDRFEVDMVWPEQRLIVEVDGFAFHSSRSAFERDRARDARLQVLGYRVIRFTWRQITEEPHSVVAMIAVAHAAAA